eukprot:TRINITY_DN1994_c0_g1_i1.p1 TRINITY_DN1994_c0_g1~~TRINITY_DN1994_c0_g1_i1.p1  ORF type:complete len:226 (-),score=63.98 TRINITY_DN1994_c0_g1_i1:368-1000(-)
MAAISCSSSIVCAFRCLERTPGTSVKSLASNLSSGSLAQSAALNTRRIVGRLFAGDEVLETAFSDPRWKDGAWDLQQFTDGSGKVDWDSVIDADLERVQWAVLNGGSAEETELSAAIPWWAKYKRFQLPEAELLNGRAAMVGFTLGYLVDLSTGTGLVEQSSGFLGKLLLLLAVAGVMLVKTTGDVEKLKEKAKNVDFSDPSWQQVWKKD